AATRSTPFSHFSFKLLRTIAGKYRSRILKSLKGLALRPTSDRLRETLFNILGPGVVGSRFLDVFAGTGAVGIEALSRSAAHVTFIENHAPAAKLIRQNLDSLKITTGYTILAADALTALQKLAAHHAPSTPGFDFIFVDPPYAAHIDYARTLEFLATANFLAPDALVIFEHHHKFQLPDQSGQLRRTRLLKQGDASLSFYRLLAGP
ncbi:MAG: 16S rRNA (guanine(966)-N(2))-methyltransferase RsmD, partial [Candidatus Acidiferrum sp.]